MLQPTILTAQNSKSSGFAYKYEGEMITLPVDEGMIAIRVPAGTSKEAFQDSVNDSLGLSSADEVANEYHADWVKYRLAETNFLAGQKVATQASTTDVPFVSPVIKDQKGRDMYMEPVIYFAVPYDLTEDRRHAILSKIPGLVEARVVSSPLGTEANLRKIYGTRPGEIFAEGKTPDRKDFEELNVAPPSYTDEREISGNELFKVQVNTKNGFDLIQIVAALAEEKDIVGVETQLELIGQHTAVPKPNDDFFDYSWHLEQSSNFDLNVRTAWDRVYGYGVSSVKVAVIDGGIQISHPDLRVAPGLNYAPDRPSTDYTPNNQYDNHGTAVAGVISGIANNTIGSVGVAPHVRVMPLRISHEHTSTGQFTTNTGWIANAINFAANNSARITNFSNELPGSFSNITTAYQNTRTSHRIVHFAATGNSNQSTISYPASIPVVMAIGATQQNATRWVDSSTIGSNYGTGIDLVAPGKAIITTDRTGTDGYATSGNDMDYTVIDGTSLASPAAAASAALIISRNPGLTAAQVESLLTTHALDMGSSGYDTVYGYGQVRPDVALTNTSAGFWINAGANDSNNFDGWKWHPNFGIFTDEAFPTHFHLEHGWQMVTGTDPDNVWIWDDTSKNWFATKLNDSSSPLYYPMLFRADGEYFYYQKGSKNPRWFFRYSTGLWVNF